MKVSAVNKPCVKVLSASNNNKHNTQTNFGAQFQYHRGISDLFIYESIQNKISESTLNKIWASFVRNTTNAIEKLKPEKGIVRLDFNRAQLMQNPSLLPQYSLSFNLPTMPVGAWAQKELGYVQTPNLEKTVIRTAEEGFEACKEAFPGLDKFASQY